MSSRERLSGWIEAVLGTAVLAGLIIQVGIFFPAAVVALASPLFSGWQYWSP